VDDDGERGGPQWLPEVAPFFAGLNRDEVKISYAGSEYPGHGLVNSFIISSGDNPRPRRNLEMIAGRRFTQCRSSEHCFWNARRPASE